MTATETKKLIRKAAGNGPALSAGERAQLQAHFEDESGRLAEMCRQRKLERKGSK